MKNLQPIRLSIILSIHLLKSIYYTADAFSPPTTITASRTYATLKSSSCSLAPSSKQYHTLRSSSITSSLSSPYSLNLAGNEDSNIDEYSRCLTPKQQLDQINSELVLSRTPTWRRIVRKPINKLIRKMNSGEIKPGTLILVRGGESEFSINGTFTGWADPKLTEEGQLQMEHAASL